jgi:hypothetical protein
MQRWPPATQTHSSRPQNFESRHFDLTVSPLRHFGILHRNSLLHVNMTSIQDLAHKSTVVGCARTGLLVIYFEDHPKLNEKWHPLLQQFGASTFVKVATTVESALKR